jgi:hypothetical protein
MRDWITASILFFAYVTVVAPLVRGLAGRRRTLAMAGSLAGLLLTAVAHLRPHSPVLHDWLIPPVLLLMAYWSSGLLFAAPMPRAEHMLDAVDRGLDVDALAAVAPRWVAELLELAYLGVYPLIPLAFAVHLLGTGNPDPERFWTVVLVTDFICFAFLPWVQTRPPRALRPGEPWRSRVRRLNLRLLGKTSIQVNTFPSGHTAEALAAWLLVLGAPWPWVWYVGMSAVMISAGAVLGRYHYVADAVAGWAVAAIVWILL